MMPFRCVWSGRSHWTSTAVVLRTTTWKEVGGPVGSVRERRGGREGITMENREGWTGVGIKN